MNPFKTIWDAYNTPHALMTKMDHFRLWWAEFVAGICLLAVVAVCMVLWSMYKDARTPDE